MRDTTYCNQLISLKRSIKAGVEFLSAHLLTYYQAIPERLGDHENDEEDLNEIEKVELLNGRCR
jgi:4-hydroxyphenylpyruvate dioxygenase